MRLSKTLKAKVKENKIKEPEGLQAVYLIDTIKEKMNLGD